MKSHKWLKSRLLRQETKLSLCSVHRDMFVRLSTLKYQYRSKRYGACVYSELSCSCDKRPKKTCMHCLTCQLINKNSKFSQMEGKVLFTTEWCTILFAYFRKPKFVFWKFDEKALRSLKSKNKSEKLTRKILYFSKKKGRVLISIEWSTIIWMGCFRNLQFDFFDPP